MTDLNLSASISIDESERIYGISDVKLNVDLHAVDSPAIVADQVLARYSYRASLMGFGRNGNPSRRNASTRTRFGRRITVREHRFDWRTGRFQSVTVERILEEHFFRLVDVPSGHLAIFDGHSNLTVELSVLDVARARPVLVDGMRAAPDPNVSADSIFARVDLLDRENDNEVVQTVESNVISDFFGPDERTSQGDDRDRPFIPIRLPFDMRDFRFG